MVLCCSSVGQESWQVSQAGVQVLESSVSGGFKGTLCRLCFWRQAFPSSLPLSPSMGPRTVSGVCTRHYSEFLSPFSTFKGPCDDSELTQIFPSNLTIRSVWFPQPPNSPLLCELLGVQGIKMQVLLRWGALLCLPCLPSSHRTMSGSDIVRGPGRPS